MLDYGVSAGTVDVKGIASLTLELQVVFSNLTWMLETEPMSSARAVYTLNH